MLAALEADRSRVTDIEAQISNIEHSQALDFEPLLVVTALAEQRLDSCKYPLLTLPNEIVSEIFLHFLPDYPLCPPLTGILSPTCLTHVCRRWREIALATPALWRAISFSSDDSQLSNLDSELPNDELDDIVSKRRAVIFDIWLRRSHSCPLSIHIIEDDDSSNISEVLAAIIPHRARWEYLHLDIYPTRLPAVEGPTPLLRHLDLCLEAHNHSMDVVTFRELPLLRTVILDNMAASLVVLPWVQLTSLTLIRVQPNKCVSLLQQTTNLVHCQLSLDTSGGDSDLPDVRLPRLESLVLNVIGPRPVTDFLECFIVPALRSLEIPELFLGSNPIDTLGSFTSKSDCKLQEAHITGPRTVPGSSYSRAFPSIHKFSFSGSHITFPDHYYTKSKMSDQDSESEGDSESSDVQSDSEFE